MNLLSKSCVSFIFNSFCLIAYIICSLILLWHLFCVRQSCIVCQLQTILVVSFPDVIRELYTNGFMQINDKGMFTCTWERKVGGPRSRDMKTLVSLRRFAFSRHLRGAPGRFELRQKRARSAAPFIVYLDSEGHFSG